MAKLPATKTTVALLVGIGLILSGVFVFRKTISVWLFTPSSLDISRRPLVASVIQSHGYLEIRHFGQRLFWRVRKQNIPIHEGDSLRTGNASWATVNFPSNYSVRLEENGQYYFERQGESSNVIISILRGRIATLSTGEQGALQILQNGFLRDPGTRFPDKPLVVRAKTAREQSARPGESPGQNSHSESLSTGYIMDVLGGEKPFFNRCYAEHLAKHPGRVPASQGRMNFSFRIDPNGSTSEVSLVSSSIDDTDLENCIASVISRARFRPFDAQPIYANYPIQFE